jgi:hypothetical protein
MLFVLDRRDTAITVLKNHAGLEAHILTRLVIAGEMITDIECGETICLATFWADNRSRVAIGRGEVLLVPAAVTVLALDHCQFP